MLQAQARIKFFEVDVSPSSSRTWDIDWYRVKSRADEGCFNLLWVGYVNQFGKVSTSTLVY